MKFKCPICESPISMPNHLGGGERIVCENCFAELAVHKHKGNFFLGCPFCKEEVFSPTNCGACERRRGKVEKWESGQLLNL